PFFTIPIPLNCCASAMRFAYPKTHTSEQQSRVGYIQRFGIKRSNQLLVNRIYQIPDSEYICLAFFNRGIKILQQDSCIYTSSVRTFDHAESKTMRKFMKQSVIEISIERKLGNLRRIQ